MKDKESKFQVVPGCPGLSRVFGVVPSSVLGFLKIWNCVGKLHRLAGRYDNPMPTCTYLVPSPHKRDLSYQHCRRTRRRGQLKIPPVHKIVLRSLCQNLQPFKGSLTRDFQVQVFLTNQFPPKISCQTPFRVLVKK